MQKQNLISPNYTYEIPEISIIEESRMDVICASSGINLPDVSLEIFGETEIL